MENGRDICNLSDAVIIYGHKTLTPHGSVPHGIIKISDCGDRPCAIKFARMSKQHVREAQHILSALGCHTHVISLIQSGTYSSSFVERVYFALGPCNELNFKQYLEEHKNRLPIFDIDWGIKYCKQLIAGMTHVHENLIIHRDLKPSNILLSHDFSILKIADFGSSVRVKSSNSMIRFENGFGTLGYRPPEGMGNSFGSLKTDIYSLGILFYFILSYGETPPGDDSTKGDINMKGGIINLSKLSVPNPKSTRHLISLMLSKDRGCRPSIWQVSEHQCWSGKETDCEFDYGCETEVSDLADTEQDAHSKNPDDSDENENIRKADSFINKERLEMIKERRQKQGNIEVAKDLRKITGHDITRLENDTDQSGNHGRHRNEKDDNHEAVTSSNSSETLSRHSKETGNKNSSSSRKEPTAREKKKKIKILEDKLKKTLQSIGYQKAARIIEVLHTLRGSETLNELLQLSECEHHLARGNEEESIQRVKDFFTKSGSYDPHGIRKFMLKMQQRYPLQAMILCRVAHDLRGVLKHAREIKFIELIVIDIHTAMAIMIVQGDSLRDVAEKYGFPYIIAMFNDLRDIENGDNEFKNRMMASCLVCVSAICDRLGKVDEKIEYCTLGINILESQYGSRAVHHKDYGMLLNNLAVAYSRLMEYEKAQDFFRRAIHAYSKCTEFPTELDKQRYVASSTALLSVIKSETFSGFPGF